MPTENTEEIDKSQQQLLYNTRSEEVQEIMGRMPSWIIRRGITLMAIIILVLFIGAYFFKYPDVIPAAVTISSGNPPVAIVARNNLPINKLLVENNEDVNAGQMLGVLNNPANYTEVEQIAVLTSQIDTCISLKKFIENNPLPQNLNLGELQSGYVTLALAIQDYLFFIRHNSYKEKISQLHDETAFQQKLLRELKEKGTKMGQQLAIQQNRFNTDSSLVAATIMSRVEYEDARKSLLDRKITTEGNYSSILQNQLQQNQLAATISETQTQWLTDKNDLEQKIRQAARQFNGAYVQWEQNYVLRSPVAGKVTFFKYWKENQFVHAGETVMIVTPPVQGFVVRGMIGLAGAGKIKPGQKVLIRLFAYPYQEYGSINGTVISRSPVAMDSIFSIQIKLSQGLHTNAGIYIPPQPQLTGTAQILTDDKSVLQRLFDKIYGENRR